MIFCFSVSILFAVSSLITSVILLFKTSFSKFCFSYSSFLIMFLRFSSLVLKAEISSFKFLFLFFSSLKSFSNFSFKIFILVNSCLFCCNSILNAKYFLLVSSCFFFILLLSSIEIESFLFFKSSFSFFNEIKLVFKLTNSFSKVSIFRWLKNVSVFCRSKALKSPFFLILKLKSAELLLFMFELNEYSMLFELILILLLLLLSNL